MKTVNYTAQRKEAARAARIVMDIVHEVIPRPGNVLLKDKTTFFTKHGFYPMARTRVARNRLAMLKKKHGIRVGTQASAALSLLTNSGLCDECTDLMKLLLRCFPYNCDMSGVEIVPCTVEEFGLERDRGHAVCAVLFGHHDQPKVLSQDMILDPWRADAQPESIEDSVYKNSPLTFHQDPKPLVKKAPLPMDLCKLKQKLCEKYNIEELSDEENERSRNSLDHPDDWFYDHSSEESFRQYFLASTFGSKLESNEQGAKRILTAIKKSIARNDGRQPHIYIFDDLEDLRELSRDSTIHAKTYLIEAKIVKLGRNDLIEKSLSLDPECQETLDYKEYAERQEQEPTNMLATIKERIDSDDGSSYAYSNEVFDDLADVRKLSKSRTTHAETYLVEAKLIFAIEPIGWEGLIERSLELNPNFADAWFYKGSWLAEMGSTESRDSMKCLEKALECNPEHEEARALKTKISRENEQEAKEILTRVKERINGDDFDSYNYGHEVTADLEKVRELSRNSDVLAETYLIEAKAFGRYLDVGPLYLIEKAIELNPNCAEAWFLKAKELSYYHSSESAIESVECCKKALECDPDHEEARALLAEFESKPSEESKDSCRAI